MAKDELDVEAIIQEVAESDFVRDAIAAEARRMLPAAQRAAYNAGANAFAKSLRVETGTRPGSKSPTGLRRPYARIIGEDTDEVRDADRGAKLTPTQILRRASRA